MEWNNRKVLITGISGFIGSNLGKELLKRGAKIYAVDNFSYIDSEMARRKLSDLFRHITLIQGDVSDDSTWKRVPKDIEYIFHFGAPSSITLFKRYPERCYKETVFGLWNILEFAKAFGIKKVIYPSSGSNYAGNEMPHREDIPLKPKNIYAAAKIACEALANIYQSSVKSLGLRIFGGYGPGEEWKRDFGSVVYLFIKDYLNNKSPEIWGDGSQTRDFIYIDDVVHCIIKAAEVDYTGVVNVGTGKSVSFRELLRTIKESVGKDIDPVFIPKESGYVENLEAETTLMRRLFGIEPIRPEEAVKKFLDYLRASS